MRHSWFRIIPAVLLMAASCSVEPEPVPSDGGIGMTRSTYTATAVSEDGARVRTTLNGSDTEGYDVRWSAKDSFRLLYKFGREYSYWGYLTYNITSAPGRTYADFSTSDYFASDEFSKPEISFYPASMVPDSIFKQASSVITPIIWPTRQEYVAGTASECPMVSFNTDPSGVFEFMNLGGVLRLTAKGSGKITSIRISADQKMSGVFYLGSSQDGFAVKMENRKDNYDFIELTCPGEGVGLDEDGVDFHFNMPPGTYSGFKIEFFDGNIRLGTRTGKKDIIIERSKITPATINVPVLGPGRLVSAGERRMVHQSAIIESVSTILPPEYQEYSSLLSLIIRTNLQIVPVTYTTTGVDGRLVFASGLIAYPTAIKESDTVLLDRIVSIQHGTCDIDEAPSTQELPMELLPVAAGARPEPTFTEILNIKYFVACMADYLGYGATRNDDLLHPYLHDRITGRCCADLISATQEYIVEHGLSVTSDIVDLVGYSQGGAATVSTMLELLERDSGWASRLGGVRAGAGPYDIPAFMDFFAGQTSYVRSCYIPYALRGLAYGAGLSPDWSCIYRNPLGDSGKSWAELEEELFSKTQVSTWTEVIGTDVTAILSPDFLQEEYGGNDEILELAEVAEENSVVNRRPAAGTMDTVKSKIRLYHSEDDNTVPYLCSERLVSAWGLDGINPLPSSDHVEAGVAFMLEYCGLGWLNEALSSANGTDE